MVQLIRLGRSDDYRLLLYGQGDGILAFLQWQAVYYRMYRYIKACPHLFILRVKVCDLTGLAMIHDQLIVVLSKLSVSIQISIQISLKLVIYNEVLQIIIIQLIRIFIFTSLQIAAVIYPGHIKHGSGGIFYLIIFDVKSLISSLYDKAGINGRYAKLILRFLAEIDGLIRYLSRRIIIAVQELIAVPRHIEIKPSVFPHRSDCPAGLAYALGTVPYRLYIRCDDKSKLCGVDSKLFGIGLTYQPVALFCSLFLRDIKAYYRHIGSGVKIRGIGDLIGFGHQCLVSGIILLLHCI